MEKISIIVPVYNVEESFFRKCIDSLINQTVADIEIILINDGSTNNSPQLCDQYAKKDSRIKVFHQENQGVSVARNKGISEATGEWITFVDPDDWVELDMCEKLINNLKDGNYDILVFSYFEVYENRINKILWGKQKSYDLAQNEYEILQNNILSYNKNFMPSYFGAVWGNLYRRKFIIDNGISFIPGLTKAQDAVFNLYALEYAKKIKYLNEAMYYYRHNESSVCYKYNPNIDEPLIRLLNSIKEFIDVSGKNTSEVFISAYYQKVLVTLIENLKLNYFHQNNKIKNSVNKQNLNNLILKYPYYSMLNNIDFKTLSYKKKLIIYLIKSKQFYLLKLLFKVNEIIKNRRYKAY